MPSSVRTTFPQVFKWKRKMSVTQGVHAIKFVALTTHWDAFLRYSIPFYWHQNAELSEYNDILSHYGIIMMEWNASCATLFIPKRREKKCILSLLRGLTCERALDFRYLLHTESTAEIQSACEMAYLMFKFSLYY